MDDRLRRALRHDLRSPLAVTVGRAGMLLEGLAGDLNEPQRRTVQAIAEAADRLRADLDALAEALDARQGPDS